MSGMKIDYTEMVFLANSSRERFSLYDFIICIDCKNGDVCDSVFV